MRQTFLLALTTLILISCQDQTLEEKNETKEKAFVNSKPSIDCGTEFDYSLKLILGHPEIKKFIDDNKTGDTLIISTDLIPDCSRGESFQMDGYSVALWEKKDAFFYGIDDYFPRIKLLDFHTNWVYANSELLIIGKDQTLHVTMDMTYDNESGKRSNRRIRNISYSIGEIIKE